MSHPSGARVSIPAPGVAGQLRRARVVSKVRDTEAYVVAVTSGPDRGRRITVQGSALTAHTDNSSTTRETR